MSIEVPAADPRALLDALDEAHAKATPGPWVTDGAELYAAHSVESGIPSEWVGETLDPDTPDHGAANAAAIVAAVNALPALTAAVRAALALADEWEASSPTGLSALAGAGRALRSTVTAALTGGGR